MRNKKSSPENRRIRLLVGAVISLSIVWFAFEYKSPIKTDHSYTSTGVGTDVIELIPITEREKIPEKPKPQTTKLNYVDNTDPASDFQITVEVGTDDIIEEPIVFIDEKEELLPDSEPFVLVEEEPSFKGNIKAYIAKNLKYPREANNYGVEGVMYVEFVIEKDGSISNVKTIRGLGYGCDEEAIRVIKNMPAWNPGKQRNVAVRVKKTLPVKFVLKD
jgi:protein TonB